MIINITMKLVNLQEARYHRSLNLSDIYKRYLQLMHGTSKGSVQVLDVEFVPNKVLTDFRIWTDSEHAALRNLKRFLKENNFPYTSINHLREIQDHSYDWRAIVILET